MKTIADRLKIAREWKGWKQAQLAVAADVSTGTIGNIEAGIRKSKGSIPQIAAALGVDYQWLENGVGEMLPTVSTQNHPLAPVQQALPAINNIAMALQVLADTMPKLTAGQRRLIGPMLAELAVAPPESYRFASR